MSGQPPPPSQEQQLVALLTHLIGRVDALEKAYAATASRPAPPQPTLQDTLQTFAGGGQRTPHPVGNGPDPGATDSFPLPSRQEIFGGDTADDPWGAGDLRPRVAPSQRPVASPVPRSGVDFQIEVPAGRPYAPAPAPQEVAIDGRQLIRCFGDDMVQVRSEDGRLLGAMPMFPEDVQTVFTELRQDMRVGMLAVRAVVVPYNRGIDPRTIAGFVPAPGLEMGPLSTGPQGRGANLENPDIGQRP